MLSARDVPCVSVFLVGWIPAASDAALTSCLWREENEPETHKHAWLNMFMPWWSQHTRPHTLTHANSDMWYITAHRQRHSEDYNPDYQTDSELLPVLTSRPFNIKSVKEELKRDWKPVDQLPFQTKMVAVDNTWWYDSSLTAVWQSYCSFFHLLMLLAADLKTDLNLKISSLHLHSSLLFLFLWDADMMMKIINIRVTDSSDLCCCVVRLSSVTSLNLL